MGWNLSATLVLGALVSTGLFAWHARRSPGIFTLAIVAFVCVLATLAVFWTLNFPGNQQTSNWTQLPGNWEILRRRAFSQPTRARRKRAKLPLKKLATGARP